MVVVSLTPPQLYSGGRASGTHRTGRWVSSTAGLDELEKRGTSCPCAIRTPDCPGRNPAINVNYFTRALNVLIKTPARVFLKTSARCLIPSLLSDLMTVSPRRRTCNFVGLLFKRTKTTVFSPYLFRRTIFSASCLRRLYSRTATKKAMTQYRCFLYPALNFASADTQ